ncbi:hypothetical protein K8F61_17340 [Microbacterium resistens]|uniref:Transcription regulator BetR N-terminal domain-containing protein n=1 Tax=Microbacterium resistens TaxID=156977 RepID=A0ABY3RQY4_9MICO|nr:helix-turn-helix domain-containing protein [Microbacterium resistens]UGS26369.1 hypothetical protein K8F61_17340 [Microbacterium resistens]
MATNSDTTNLIAQAIADEDRTQAWTADKAGIAQPTFYRKMRGGGGDWTVSEVARIAKALRRHPADLLPAEFAPDNRATPPRTVAPFAAAA